jgi:signal transduction histidine kinase
MDINPLFKRQLRKCGFCEDDLNNLTEKYKQIMKLVNESYNDFDEDRILLERSIDISSEEYSEHLEQIKELQSTLIQNEKMASIGQLSAGIAHEINNPLGYIQNNIKTLSKYIPKIQKLQSLTDDYIDCDEVAELEEKRYKIKAYSKDNKMDLLYSDLSDLITETLDGIYRIDEIVKSLLYFSRKLIANELEDYDLNKGITDTLSIAYNEIKYYAKIHQNLNEIPLIKAKPGEIHQVLLNIILNSVYAIKDKGIDGDIRIKTYHDNDFVYCEIEDNGIGIPEENISRIFEPFFSTKPIGKGTGLGLSISYDIIVNKHNGKIDVKSAVGKGTIFIITLPQNIDKLPVT